MYPFDSIRGRLALGLAGGSGGGWVILGTLQHVKDPQWAQFLQLLLVFWIIFVVKTTLHYVRQLSGEAAQQARPAAAAAAGDDDEGARATRRRRARRD